MIYSYPPVLTKNAIEYAPLVPEAAPPKLHAGYQRDPQNLWRQVSEWRACSARKIKMQPRPCGRALLTMFCECEGCPLLGRILRPDDCEECGHA